MNLVFSLFFSGFGLFHTIKREVILLLFFVFFFFARQV